MNKLLFERAVCNSKTYDCYQTSSGTNKREQAGKTNKKWLWDFRVEPLVENE